MNYNPQYTDWLNKAGLSALDLDTGMQHVIAAFNKALYHWQKAGEAEQKKLANILVQTDAFISANIYQQYKDRLQPKAVDKSKLEAFKEKARLLKQKNQS